MAGLFDAKLSHNLPAAALRHFCGANANIYVNFVAYKMFHDFQLSVKGQRDITTCLSNLPFVETPDERLTLGWGPDHLIYQPVVHQWGYEHLAVMIALGSVFHDTYAAEVCQSYAASLASESDMLPHITQWRNHIQAASGCLTASNFTQLVEEYIRLDPYQVGPGSNSTASRCRVAPRAMAKALHALSKLTSKKEKHITLKGGAVLGWYAAFCEFFYDLPVALLSRKGEKLHGDPSNEATQVVLIYHEEPDLEVLADHWSTIQDKKTVDDDPYWSKHTHFLPFGGRVEWHSLLPQVFGHAFWVLEREHGKLLSEVLGNAARGLEGDYEYNKEHHREEFLVHINENAYGAGLIQNLTGWLPELRRGQGRMERQLKHTIQEAADHYEGMIAKLGQLCNCAVCTVTDSQAPPKDGYCLPVICETIIALGLAISRMTVAAGIYPSRQGVQGIYTAQAKKRTEVKHVDLTVTANREKYYATIYSNEWRAPDARRLQNAIELFSGTRPERDLPESLVAVAHEGICCYMLEFRRAEGAVPRSGERGFIEVTTGAVNLRQKVFTRVSSEPVRVDDSSESQSWEEVQFKHRSKPMYCK